VDLFLYLKKEANSMWFCGIGHKVFDKNCDQDIEAFLSQGEDYTSDYDGEISNSGGSSNGDGEYSEDEEDTQQHHAITFDAVFGCDPTAALWL
jgi:hypothetical protein